MRAFKSATIVVSETFTKTKKDKNGLLMMVIPNPRESRHGGDHQSEVGDNAKHQYSVVLRIVSHEVTDNFEKNPYDPGSGTSAMNTTQMLEGSVGFVAG